MGVKSYVKNTFKANTNVKGWIGWNSVSSNAKLVKSLVNDIKPDKNEATPKTQETFEQAVARLGLTDAQLQKQMRSHFLVALFCGTLGLFAFAWFVYLLIKAMFLSSLIALSLSGLMLVYAGSEHFFYYRIKQRRLDCTVDEWISKLFSK